MLGLKDMVIAKIAGALAVLFLAGLVVQSIRLWSANSQIGRLEQRNERLSADLSTCRANTATLNASISRQNAAVSAMRAQGEARAAELDRVAQRARQEAESANARAARIMARRPTGDACADARALIMESVR